MGKTSFFAEMTARVSRLVKGAGYTGIVVASLFFAYESYAQETTQGLGSYSAPAATSAGTTPAGATPVDFSSLSSLPGTAKSTFLSAPVDNAIDEDNYYIGGGDKFHIFLVRMPSQGYDGTVNQNGDLLIPTIGIIPVGKVTLARAKAIIAEYMYQKLKQPNEIRISLDGIKTAQITGFGSVNNPGTYVFSGATRLWDALKAMTSGNMSDLNFREVCRKNLDSVAYFDILKFLYKGDFSQNPYVYPGDELYITPATKRVFIGGGGLKAWISGRIPIHPHERLADFLSFFFFHEYADSEHILVSRTDNGRSSQLITVNLNLKQDFYLQDRDGIIIPIKGGGISNDTSAMVSVGGEVVRGGVYPIPKSGTSVQVIIALAGGYTAYADTNKTVVLRMDKKPPPPNLMDAISRPEISGALAVAGATKDYLVIRLKDHPETIVQNGDHVWVPRKENMVFISGCVKFPGAYAFKPHQKKDYYIDLAGGFAERADKSNIAIVTPYIEAYLSKSSSAEIEGGDFIAVPVKTQYKFYDKVIAPTISTILSAGGFLIAILSLVHW
jgi:polysaccharide export outer membrane protein